jgi:hypothetical protein
VKVVTSSETIHAAMDAARKQAIADCAKVAREYGTRRNGAGPANKAAAAKASAAADIATNIEKLGAR